MSPCGEKHGTGSPGGAPLSQNDASLTLAGYGVVPGSRKGPFTRRRSGVPQEKRMEREMELSGEKEKDPTPRPTPDAAPRPTPDAAPPTSSASGAIESLNRFLSAAVQETWDDLDRALRITENNPDFSGILPLGDPSLEPYLRKPGIFFILGPQPKLSLLHIGASRGPIGLVLHSRIERHPQGGWAWRWEKRSESPPTFAAIATMEDYWAFAPPLRNLLARRLGGAGQEAGREEDPEMPIV